MVNKRGWIRIVEAIFGIMIMAGVLLTVYGEHTSSVKNSDYIIQSEKDILKEISDDYQLRGDILNETYFPVKDFVGTRLSSSYSFSLTVCNLSAETCNSCGDLSGKEIYSEEIVIGSSPDKYNPKIVRISAWNKGKSEREMLDCVSLLPLGSVCTDNSNCTSGYCGEVLVGVKNCLTMPVWYYDYDCDGWGNGINVSSVSAPLVSAGCVNTTFSKPNISKLDCNDTNVLLTDNCPAAIRWYFDADCDGFRNASIIPALSVIKPSFSGCINSTSEVPGINESSHVDCDDNNKLYNLTCPALPSCNSYSKNADGAIVLCTCLDLQNVSSNLGASYVLGQDIDCSETKNWNSGAGFNPIGRPLYEFTGSFNGNGWKILNLYINRGAWQTGLFGAAQGAIIQKVGLVDANITGSYHVGILLAYGTASVSECYSTGNVRGVNMVGGLVGSPGGSVINSYSWANVTGSSYVGGLVGQRNGLVNYSYSTGKVTGASSTGGLIGIGENHQISSYWDNQTSGQSTSAAGIGKTTSQMKTASTFSGWNTSVWNLVDGSYPTFRSSSDSPSIINQFSDSLVAYWAFDNDLTEEIAEVSVNATFFNNTTGISPTFVSDRHGNSNLALSFDGLNDWVDTNMNINASEMKTISFFAKFNDLNKNGQEIVDKSRSGEGIEVLLYNGGFSYYIMNATSQTYLTIDKSSLGDGNWHQIVATFNYPGNLSLYVDGNLKSTNVLNNEVKNLDKTVLFGKWYEPESYSFGGSRFFNGSLDDVMIFNKALNSTEVSQLYDALI